MVNIQQVLQIKRPNTSFDHVTPEQHIGAFSNLAPLSAAVSRTSFVCVFQNRYTSLLKNNYVLWCDNAVITVGLGLGTKTTWLGLGKNHGLGSNDHFVKVRETCGFKLFSYLVIYRCHGYNNNHGVKVRGQS